MTNLLHRAGEVLRTFEKNGKPYQEVIEICPRCGGSGHYSYNQMDGTMCYGCNGQGVQKVERRIYTEKEQAQLDRAKAKRIAKKEAEQIAQSERTEQEKQNKVNKYIEENPVTYIVIDKDSYSKKDMLKESKYKWLTWNWVGHKKVEGVEVIEVNTSEVINEYGNIVDTAIKNAIEEYKNKPVENIEDKKESEYIGTVGEKIEKELTLVKYISYETMYGISKIYLFEDENGNVYKWNTTNYIEQKEGEKVRIKGTIKEHEEYKEQKQTVLTRCKVL